MMAKITRRTIMKSIPTYGLAAVVPATAAAMDSPDRQLLALGVEFEARWSAERAVYEAEKGQDTHESDERCNAAARQTREVVELMTGHTAKTLAGYRLLARAYVWCRGENPDQPMAVSLDGPYDTTDKAIRSNLINSLLGHI
ncbi:hypothetical protein [Mesorhizobium sp. Pch-S]|uniref:hypothetical protein n=1 Tax=Mesorhizobium sp. Pch-S TaxID=2082387 RepID=UPI00101196D0|nr:hypothetical protein [Mesorhizobium sp. Pch-S]